MIKGHLAATRAYTGQTLKYELVSRPVHGKVWITDATTGAFTYSASSSSVHADSFTFRVRDRYGTLSNVATETLSN